MGKRSVWKQPKWRLFVFRRSMALLSAALVLCALIAGAYQSRVYFTFAAAAGGVLLGARAWWAYLRWKDGKPLERTGDRVPRMLRGQKEKKRRKPAFLMDSRDFDDDLTAYTAAEAEDFTEREGSLALIWSSLLSGAVLTVLSFMPV